MEIFGGGQQLPTILISTYFQRKVKRNPKLLVAKTLTLRKKSNIRFILGNNEIVTFYITTKNINIWLVS